MILPGAVIFDMDGVVLDSEPVYRLCWQRAAAELGYPISDALYTRVLGHTDGDAEQILITEFGRSFPRAEFHTRWTRYFEQQLEAGPIPRKKGVVELLDFLDQRPIRKALATSTARDKAIRSLGELRRRFEVMVTGDEIERGKPAPDIFLAAAERTGLPPDRCLVLEDSEAGVRAAHAAGMPVLLVPDLREPHQDVLRLVSGVCRSLDEVTRLLDSNDPRRSP